MKNKSKRNLFDRWVLRFNYLAISLLFLSNLSPLIDPNSFWILAPLGLIFPYILMLNLIFGLYWLLKFQKPFILTFGIVLVSYFNLKYVVPLFNPPSEDILAGGLKIVSYNVRVFDLYNWTHNQNTRNNILKIMEEEKGDIYAFQEFFHSEEPVNFLQIEKLKETLKTPYHYVYDAVNIKNSQYFGMAIFSRYPIQNMQNIPLKTRGTNLCIFADIIVPSDTIRLFNAHLGSLHFNKEDYQFIEQLVNGNSQEQLSSGTRIFKRLVKAFKNRSNQAQMIRDEMDKSPYPTFLCGDINDSPVSFSYRTLSRNLTDSFLERGKGIGTTYAGKIPGLRIDYILHDKSYLSESFKILKKPYSDHYPLVCYVKKKPI